jgi:hypothetical protein
LDNEGEDFDLGSGAVLVNVFIIVYILFYIHLVHPRLLLAVEFVARIELLAALDALPLLPQLLLLFRQAGWDTNSAEI